MSGKKTVNISTEIIPTLVEGDVLEHRISRERWTYQEEDHDVHFIKSKHGAVYPMHPAKLIEWFRLVR